MSVLESLVEDYQLGSMTSHEMLAYLCARTTLQSRDRRKALSTFKTLSVGIRLLRKFKADRNGQLGEGIPQDIEWKKLILLSSKDQAKWYKKHCPEVGTLEYNMFKRLCRAFGIGGNEFYYWLRKLH